MAMALTPLGGLMRSTTIAITIHKGLAMPHTASISQPTPRGGSQRANVAMLLMAGLLGACGSNSGIQHANVGPMHEAARAPAAQAPVAYAPAAPAARAPAAPVAASHARTLQGAVQVESGGTGRADRLARPPAASRDALAVPAMQAENERYDVVKDNPVKLTAQDSVSTLSLDVDTGAYSNVRRFLKQGKLPPADAVRVEELINYFPYSYPSSGQAGAAFGISTEVAPAPWNANNLLLRVGVKAVDQQTGQMPPANLVFLVDVSGSMNAADKLPLVKTTLRLLVEQLRAQDRVSIVTYSGRVALALPASSDKQHILAVVDGLQASGSTAGGAALAMAYEQARAAYMPGGINRIVMATDGDFNLGVSSVDQIKSMVTRERSGGISLTTLGYGQGNYNEPMMQQLAQVGNGNYSYIDSAQEARKVLVEELSSTFNTVAADVKLQLEFNPATVAEWRLIGYENRLLSEADFRNDQVDAVEIGAGKSVTALYELTPVGKPTLHGARRYGAATPQASTGSKPNELGELRVRFKQPGQAKAQELTQAIGTQASAKPSTDWHFAAAVAGFGQLLRGGQYTGQWRYDDVLALAQQGRGTDPQGYRAEFVQLVEMARSLTPKAPPANVRAP